MQALTPSDVSSKLHAAMRADHVKQYSIYVIDPRTRFRFAMSPERIRTHSDVTIIRRDATKDLTRLRSFDEALRHTRATKIAPPTIDVRYAISIGDDAGNEIAFVCMNGDGSVAFIGGQTYKTSGPLSKWFVSIGRHLLKIR